ncbi:LmeA family phospholipid-binding protein [Rubrobacter marinus]|uniref:LmeA family phospholipid-binding protein n=1 Tax=Rubrobacter marinus TaxID=2653852 RepID=UPI00140DD517|nr:DUF2993 domain-containing protein [Rubrobacter marinus]
MLLVGAVLVVGTYTVLPPLVEGYVARNVQDRLGLAETPEVDLTSEPAPFMLLGEFSDGRVSLPPSVAGNVSPEEVAIDLDPFDVDVTGSVRGGALRTEAPVTGGLRVELSEAEVNRIATSQVSSFPVTGVDLREGSALVGSEVAVLGFPVPVGVEGGVEVQDGALVFVPSRVEAFGTTLPEDLTGQLLEGTSFTYALGEQYGGSVVTGAELLEDRVVLTGELGELPVGGAVDPP